MHFLTPFLKNIQKLRKKLVLKNISVKKCSKIVLKNNGIKKF